jgi:hypothetical protein
MVLEHPSVLEAADVRRLEARVSDQHLGDLPRTVLRGEKIRRPDALLRDFVEHEGEIEIEALRRRPADNRLHLMCAPPASPPSLPSSSTS